MHPKTAISGQTIIHGVCNWLDQYHCALGDLVQREYPQQLEWNRGGVMSSKPATETVQDYKNKIAPRLLRQTNRKSCTYTLSIGTKINDLWWPWTAETHSCEKNRFTEPTVRAKCKSTILVSRNITYMRMFVRRGAEILDAQTFPSKFPTRKSTLLYSNTQSLVGFSVIPKCVTLNDL